MIKLVVRLFIRNLPWVLLLVTFTWLYFTNGLPFQSEKKTVEREIRQGILLEKVTALGKMELVKYQFQEITEIRNISRWKMFFQQYSPDMKVALVSRGEAVGCVNFEVLNSGDLLYVDDTLRIRLPEPEICYYKIDLEKSSIYSLETGFLATDEEEKKMIEEVYQQAEKNIKAAAIEGGIIKQTRENARQFLAPFFENLTNVPVDIQFYPAGTQIEKK